MDPRSLSYSKTRIDSLQPECEHVSTASWSRASSGLKIIASPTLMCRTRRALPGRTPFSSSCKAASSACTSSRLDRQPFQGLRSRGPASRGAERSDSVAYHNWLTGALFIYIYIYINELTFPKPYGGMKIARRCALWTAALDLSVGTGVCKGNMQRSHIGNAFLRHIACSTDHLSQHTISNMRLTQANSNDIEPMFVSNWGKPENGVFQLRWHYLPSVSWSCTKFCNLGARTFQSCAKRLPIPGLLVTWSSANLKRPSGDCQLHA